MLSVMHMESSAVGRHPRAGARGSVADQLGALLLVGAAVVVGWTLLAAAPSADDAALLVLVAVGVVMATGLLSGLVDRRSNRTLGVVIAAVNGMVSLGIVFAGTLSPGFAFFYLWATPYAFVVLSARQAALHAVWAIAGLGAALLVLGDGGLDYWVFASASIVVVGLLSRYLATLAHTSDRRFRLGFEQTSVPSALVACDGAFADVNGAMERMLGLPAAELTRTRVTDITVPGHRPRVLAALQGGGEQSLGAPLEATLRTFSGDEVLGCLTIAPIDDRGACFHLQVEDVTEQRRAEQQRAAVARDNALILDCAGDGIFRMDAAGRIVYANPAAGELLGRPLDQLIGADAHDLVHHSRADGSPYPVLASPIHAAARDGQVSRVSDEVFWRADGTSFAVDYTSAPIREDGRVTGAVCVFADITDRALAELEARQQGHWRARIEEALTEGRFLVYSQPILDLAAGEVAGEELLIRMRGETLTDVIAPSHFLPEAERHGLMTGIDQWMIGQGLGMAARGRKVAVNISAQSLGSPGLVTEIADGIAAFGVDPADLCFEITETSAVHHMDEAQAFARAIRDLGCSLALDDFGTGFGSFNYLKSLPAQFLKIDIEFVRDLVNSESDQRIVQTIVRMARDFGQQTIAEGVEDEATLVLLRSYGVDFAQGYFIGRPLPAYRGIV
jgi:PAS domain S-box-containing protein